MPFTFPDPSVQTVVYNHDTGERWEYSNGIWELSDDQSPEPTPAPCPDPTPEPSCGGTPSPSPTHSALEEAIEELQAEIILLRSDIIELRAELSSATTANLILE